MRAWSREVRQKPGGSGISREVELSEKSTPHLRPPDPITPFPFSIDLILCDYTTDACETASFRSTLWIRFSSVQFSSEGNANDDMIWGFKSLVFSPFDFFFLQNDVVLHITRKQKKEITISSYKIISLMIII